MTLACHRVLMATALAGGEGALLELTQTQAGQAMAGEQPWGQGIGGAER